MWANFQFQIPNFTLVPMLLRGNAYHLLHSPQTCNLRLTRSSPVCGLQTETLRPTRLPFPRRSMGTRGSWKLEIRNWPTHQNDCVRDNFQFQISNFTLVPTLPRGNAYHLHHSPQTGNLPITCSSPVCGRQTETLRPTQVPFPRRSMGTRRKK